MARPIPRTLLPIIATQLAGDVGPYTTYTNKRGRIVAFAKAPPKKPPTLKQLHQRARWKLSTFDYRSLTEQTKQLWRHIASGSGALHTGPSLYQWASLTTDSEQTIATLAAQAKRTNPPPWKHR